MGLANREKFNPTSYNDIPFAVIFLAHIAGLIGWIIVAASTGKYARPQPHTAFLFWQGEAARGVAAGQDGYAVVTLTFASVFVAIAWAAVWLFLLQTYATEMVTVAVWFFPIMMIALGCLLMGVGAVLPGAFLLVIGAVVVYFVMKMGDRIEFTGRLFKGVSVVYSSSKGIFATAFAVVLAQAAFLILWLLAVIPFVLAKRSDAHGPDAGGAGPSPLVWFGLLLSLFWSSQVLSNVLAVSSGGVIARWYFNEQTEEAAKTSTAHACTYYFGSICYGSLLIAIIQTLKAIADSFKDSDDGNTVSYILASIASCILGCLESIAKFFNTYAFAYISIYGLPFYDAGHEVFELLEKDGTMSIINYSLAGMVTFFGTLAGAVLVGGLNALSAWRLGLATPFIVGAGILGFVVALAVMSVVSRLMEAGTTTLFVCYAEEPAKLQNARAELYDAFSECKALKQA